MCGLDFSPIKGPEGNIEFLIYLKKCGTDEKIDVDSVVSKAHKELDVNGGERQ